MDGAFLMAKSTAPLVDTVRYEATALDFGTARVILPRRLSAADAKHLEEWLGFILNRTQYIAAAMSSEQGERKT